MCAESRLLGLTNLTTALYIRPWTTTTSSNDCTASQTFCFAVRVNLRQALDQYDESGDLLLLRRVLTKLPRLTLSPSGR